MGGHIGRTGRGEPRGEAGRLSCGGLLHRTGARARDRHFGRRSGGGGRHAAAMAFPPGTTGCNPRGRFVGSARAKEMAAREASALGDNCTYLLHYTVRVHASTGGALCRPRPVTPVCQRTGRRRLAVHRRGRRKGAALRKFMPAMAQGACERVARTVQLQAADPERRMPGATTGHRAAQGRGPRRPHIGMYSFVCGQAHCGSSDPATIRHVVASQQAR
jgi:hypothetical protein